jgi:hypothetical protein
MLCSWNMLTCVKDNNGILLQSPCGCRIKVLSREFVLILQLECLWLEKEFWDLRAFCRHTNLYEFCCRKHSNQTLLWIHWLLWRAPKHSEGITVPGEWYCQSYVELKYTAWISNADHIGLTTRSTVLVIYVPNLAYLETLERRCGLIYLMAMCALETHKRVTVKPKHTQT